jgi:hypothetical protein
VFENRMLRTIFVPEKEEGTGGWIKRHNEEIHNLYSSPNIRPARVRRGNERRVYSWEI